MTLQSLFGLGRVFRGPTCIWRMPPRFSRGKEGFLVRCEGKHQAWYADANYGGIRQALAEAAVFTHRHALLAASRYQPPRTVPSNRGHKESKMSSKADEPLPPENAASLLRLDRAMSRHGRGRIALAGWRLPGFRWTQREKQEVREAAASLVAAGWLEPAPGPRGGEGWRITDAGVGWVQAEELRRLDVLEQRRAEERLAELRQMAAVLRSNGWTVIEPGTSRGEEHGQRAARGPTRESDA